jgi:hypothetical protein
VAVVRSLVPLSIPPATDGDHAVRLDQIGDAAGGRWEVVVTGSPPVAVTDDDETDWLYAWIGDT